MLTSTFNVIYQASRKEVLPRLVQTACKYSSTIMISYDNKSINAKSLMGVLALMPAENEKITLTIEGADETEAMAEINQILGTN